MKFESLYGCGDELKDKTTDFNGIVMCKSIHFVGYIHYGLQSVKLKEDGYPADWVWFAQKSLEKIGEKTSKCSCIETKYNNGDELCDMVSGFKGVSMIIYCYITGCIEYSLAARKIKKDGTIWGLQQFNEKLLQLRKKSVVNIQ